MLLGEASAALTTSSVNRAMGVWVVIDMGVCVCDCECECDCGSAAPVPADAEGDRDCVVTLCMAAPDCGVVEEDEVTERLAGLEIERDSVAGEVRPATSGATGCAGVEKEDSTESDITGLEEVVKEAGTEGREEGGAEAE